MESLDAFFARIGTMNPREGGHSCPPQWAHGEAGGQECPPSVVPPVLSRFLLEDRGLVCSPLWVCLKLLAVNENVSDPQPPGQDQHVGLFAHLEASHLASNPG